MEDNQVISSVIASSKYKNLNPATISNVYISISDSGEKEQRLRAKLHQVWGAYYTTRPKFEKLLKKIRNLKDVDSLLAIHSSTKERIGEYQEIYKYIFNSIGKGRSIVDIGCGFNPLLIARFSNMYSLYLGVDIDIHQQNFLSEVMNILNIVNIKLTIGDGLIDRYNGYDCTFALKLLPVLDQIDKEKCNLFLSQIESKYFVVSFPTKSLGGKEKGMKNNYEDIYIPRITSLGWKLLSCQSFKSENIYIFII